MESGAGLGSRGLARLFGKIPGNGFQRSQETGLRLDRLLTLHLFRTLMRPDRGRASILMYHGISSGHEDYHPYFQTLTSPSVFADQMRFLAENDYNVIDLMTLVEIMCADTEVPPKSVALTFDDGLRDFYTNALPVLQEHGFPATVFLVTGHIDNSTSINGSGCLSWDQVRELDRYRISFGSHTVSHPYLNLLAKKDLDFELTRSKDRIESELGKKIEAFSYPFGFPEYDRPFLQILRSGLAETGYKCCLTTRVGTALAGDDPFSLKRLPVNSMDDNLLLEAKMEGAYDWIYNFQLTYKRIRGKNAEPRRMGALGITH